MAVIPNGQKFQTLSSNVDTTERRSALINSREATFTMADITETVNAGSGSSYLVYTGYITQSGTSAPTVTTNQTHPTCLLYTSPSPRDGLLSRMPSSA